MHVSSQLPFPVLDALPMGAHRLIALTDDALFDACGVRVLFTGRDGGVSDGVYASMNTGAHVGDDLEAVERNRRLVCEAAGVSDAALLVLNQVHGTDFVRVADASRVEEAHLRAEDGADGVVVEVPGVPTLLNAADCLLFVAVSPSGRFAVVHAGWRGAVAGIAGKAIRALSEGDSFGPGDYNVYIGPHIRSECFEVGDDVAARFVDAFGAHVVPHANHVSLASSVSVDLERAGIDLRRVADCGICTNCHPDRYYSYRAMNGECGRHAAFAVRVG